MNSIGIIGFGDFGQFIATLAKERFPEVAVKIASSRFPIDGKQFYSLEEVCATDILFLCVPISAFEETVQKILPLLGATTLVVDIATVKVHTSTILRKCNVPRFLATHPMFGPYSYAKQGNSLDNLRIAVCDSSLQQEEYDQILNFLRNANLKVLELGAEEHDTLVAETLFLTHLIGQTVHTGGFERTVIDTVSFGFLMDAVESVQHDDALFRDVFTYNPHCKEVLKRYVTAQRTIAASLTHEPSS